MDQGFLKDLPAVAQLFIYGLAGLGVAGWLIIRYFKEAATTKKEVGSPGLLLAGDNEQCKGLTAALDRCSSTGDRLDATMRRLDDSNRDLREELGKFRGQIALAATQPRDEELNRLLRDVAARLQ